MCAWARKSTNRKDFKSAQTDTFGAQTDTFVTQTDTQRKESSKSAHMGRYQQKHRKMRMIRNEHKFMCENVFHLLHTRKRTLHFRQLLLFTHKNVCLLNIYLISLPPLSIVKYRFLISSHYT